MIISKRLQLIVVAFCFALFFNNCKKYDEGGLVKQTRLHLFGGHKIGDNKTWKLKLYEVNGIDSTNLITGAGAIPDFYNKFITFTYDGWDGAPKYIAKTFLFDFHGYIGFADKVITVGGFNAADTTNCKIIDNINYCSRNLLRPESLFKSYEWQIKKLTKKEFILVNTLKNSYKIILTQ